MKPSGGKTDDFSERMKRLRTKAGMTLEKLSSETGLTEEYLEQIENQKIMPTVSSIIQISKALTIDSGVFLSKQEEKAAKKRKAESFQLRRKAYSYKTLTPDAEHKHMKGFLVTIDPETEHGGVEYHHEGEEFVYVLEGRADIQVGQKLHTLHKGQSLHFNSAITHKLRNPGKKKSELIIVVYTP
jgi:transcriptional regulator with XRE-family HTH domain